MQGEQRRGSDRRQGRLPLLNGEPGPGALLPLPLRIPHGAARQPDEIAEAGTQPVVHGLGYMAWEALGENLLPGIDGLMQHIRLARLAPLLRRKPLDGAASK